MLKKILTILELSIFAIIAFLFLKMQADNFTDYGQMTSYVDHYYFTEMESDEDFSDFTEEELGKLNWRLAYYSETHKNIEKKTLVKIPINSYDHRLKSVFSNNETMYIKTSNNSYEAYYGGKLVSRSNYIDRYSVKNIKFKELIEINLLKESNEKYVYVVITTTHSKLCRILESVFITSLQEPITGFEVDYINLFFSGVTFLIATILLFYLALDYPTTNRKFSVPLILYSVAFILLTQSILVYFTLSPLVWSCLFSLSVSYFSIIYAKFFREYYAVGRPSETRLSYILTSFNFIVLVVAVLLEYSHVLSLTISSKMFIFVAINEVMLIQVVCFMNPKMSKGDMKFTWVNFCTLLSLVAGAIIYLSLVTTSIVYIVLAFFVLCGFGFLQSIFRYSVTSEDDSANLNLLIQNNGTAMLNDILPNVNNVYEVNGSIEILTDVVIKNIKDITGYDCDFYVYTRYSDEPFKLYYSVGKKEFTSHSLITMNDSMGTEKISSKTNDNKIFYVRNNSYMSTNLLIIEVHGTLNAASAELLLLFLENIIVKVDTLFTYHITTLNMAHIFKEVATIANENDCNRLDIDMLGLASRRLAQLAGYDEFEVRLCESVAYSILLGKLYLDEDLLKAEGHTPEQKEAYNKFIEIDTNIYEGFTSTITSFSTIVCEEFDDAFAPGTHKYSRIIRVAYNFSEAYVHPKDKGCDHLCDHCFIEVADICDQIYTWVDDDEYRDLVETLKYNIAPCGDHEFNTKKQLNPRK